MRILIAAILLTSLSLSGWAEEEPISFQRDVRPILSDKCFACHGPDAKNQESPFRIDSFEEAVRDHDGVRGIVPGDLTKSAVHHHIHSKDKNKVMPPPKKGKLTEEEKAILDRWILEGAQYEKHWSFVNLPEAVTVPEIEGATHPIDAFIQKEVKRVGLEPSPEVSREKWLRRVTFDLTGLPPTLQELLAFISDESENAYEKVVDRLLASDAYAERMTSEWLDVARYSDTNGYQQDFPRRVFPWRDWVIKAFRENLPYDDFVVWQLAGDLLPDPTQDQLVATAFNRLHSLKVEGGSVEDEFRIEGISDRTHTVGTAFLGMTMECARCHDHKYDPITMKDYYVLGSYFSNIDEAGLMSFFSKNAVPPPAIDLPTEAQEQDLEKARQKVAQTQKELAAIQIEEVPDFDLSASPDQVVYLPMEYTDKHKQTLQNLADGESPAKIHQKNVQIEGKVGKGVRMSGDFPIDLPQGVGHFDRDQPFSYAIWVNAPQAFERAVLVRRSRGWWDAASQGYELLIENGKLSVGIIHFWPGDAIRVEAVDPLPIKEWAHIGVTYDGSSKAKGVNLYVNGEKVKTKVIRDTLTRTITRGGFKYVGLGERFRDKGFKNGLMDEFYVFKREISPFEVRRLYDPSANPSAEEKQEFYRMAIHEPSREKRAALQTAREAFSKIKESIPQIMVMKEYEGKPREDHILGRGVYSEKGEKVEPGDLSFLPPIPKAGKRSNRLDFAKWLTADDHPLTARVTVNRYWQMLFGTGLVSTPEDFGSQGKPPTHPALLDWLARDFVDHGWDLHHLLRQIVLSSTYRQASQVTDKIQEIDPTNQWLSRSPSYKLSAEMVRDNVLAISGLMSDEVGGESAAPYDLANAFKPTQPGKGDELYRRSVYTFWQRTAPSPMMMTMDSSAKDVCRVKREETNSPLQSLVMLNSPQFIEAARVTAGKLLVTHGDNDAGIINDAFLMFTSRTADAKENAILLRLVKEQEETFKANPEAITEYFNTGATKLSEEVYSPRLAAVAVLVSTLMNFDESFTKR